MSAASLLRSLSPSAMPGPVLPMDMAMRFYISHSPPPLRGFLSSYEAPRHRNKGRAQRDQAALRPCLSSQQRTDGCDGWGGKGLKKKVVFADTKGMSLTAIHVFSKNDDERGAGAVEELQFDLSDLESAAMELKISPVQTLALDFKQPSADYLDFRNRLIRNAVCLENCSLQERSLSGTVKVRNVGFEKSVQVRTTFDSWTTFSDVDCTFMNNVYGCHDTDTFAFVLDLPANIPPQHLVEFCICFRVQDQVFWDNNDGKNYVIKHLGWDGGTSSDSVEHKKAAESRGGGVKVLEMDLDQFGSPRMCSGFFPGWQNWSQANTAVPYW
ncbi:protein phosphatase 1 regulatory subunit 3C-B-like [Nerophis lumbriciformis]|uniref:protein phosphatase 1 regulatory subunit 3C-B-like n=1 Tax=Nerophis lumbriciformis TaxID=546530 RepID=UPI002ADF9FA2|nr:protein phosphatase 1 regulatory subunit 3C-B-like [Nerophis lumbriciformis]